LLLLAVPLFGYVAYKGITNIARMYEILGIMFLSIVVVLCIFMIFQGQKENALPLFYSGDFNIKPLIKNLITPFGGIEILFFIPLTTNNKKVAKHNFLTVIFIVAFFILVVESTIMILGLNNTISFNDAFIEAIKIVRLPVIERTDIFYLTFGLTSIFAGMIATFIGMLEFACKIFSKVKRQYLTIIISILFYIASYLLSIFNNVVDILSEITIILVLTSTIIIPTVLFVIAKFKKSISK